MSKTISRPRPDKKRLRRTMMFMNAQKPGLIKDAYIYGSDSIILDLEDAVAESEKDAARAAKVQCFDTVYTNLDDMEGFRKEVEMIKMMGFDGKSIINPRQIPVVHEIFTPTQKEIIFSEKVVREIDEKKVQGIGVFTVDGKMIDIAFYDGAKRVIELAKASGVYKGDL